MSSSKSLLLVAFLCLSFAAVSAVTQQELDQLKMLLQNFLQLPVSNATKTAIETAVQNLNGVTDQAQIKTIFVNAFEVIKNEPAIPEDVRNRLKEMIDSVVAGSGNNGGSTGNSGIRILPSSFVLIMTYFLLTKLV